MRDININSIRSVERAIDILNTFSPYKPIQTIDQIAAAAKLPKATVYRLLYTLELRGLIHYNSNTLQYRLGFKLLEYSGLLMSFLDVRQEAEKILIELQMKTQQTILMTIRENESMVYVFKRENPEGLKFSSFLGQHRPLGYGVMGRIFISFIPEQQLAALLKTISIHEWLPETASDEKSVRDYLQKIRDERVCVEINETNAGVTGIGAPVFNAEGEIIAAIGLIGPSVQLADDRLESLKEMLKSAALMVSSRMGYRYCPRD